MYVPLDQVYIDKVLAGDSSAFAVLVERHKNKVFNICIKIIRNPQTAEELAQDVFLKAFEKLETFKNEAKFSTWLFRIAYNMSISENRKSRPESVQDPELYLESFEDDHLIDLIEAEALEAREKRLRSAIGLLDGEQQLLLQLYYDQDLPISEVSQITQLSPSNVKVKLHRTRQRLYEIMQGLTLHLIKPDHMTDKDQKLKELLQGNFDEAHLSSDFTKKLMHKIEGENTAPERVAFEYTPVISRLGWTIIAAFLLFVFYLGFTGDGSSERTLPSYLPDWQLDFRFCNHQLPCLPF